MISETRFFSALNVYLARNITAVSLQEAQEKVIIEQSVTICEENNTEIAKYPFLKDPVEFLTVRHDNSNNYDQALKVL